MSVRSYMTEDPEGQVRSDGQPAIPKQMIGS